MKKTISIVSMLFFGMISANSQTLLNTGFENGTTVSGNGQVDHADHWNSGCANHYSSAQGYYQGSPDLYGCAGTGNYSGLPAGGYGIYQRPGSTGCRFVGMLTPDPQDQMEREESIIQTTGQFTDDFVYTISMYVARTSEINGIGGQASTVQLEAVLRKAGNCNDEKVIPINVNIPVNNSGPSSNNWKFITTDFHLTTPEENENYTQLEIRTKFVQGQAREMLFVDDVVLSKIDRAIPDVQALNFSNIEEDVDTYYGPMDIHTFCNPSVLLDCSGTLYENQYQMSVKEIDIATWNTIGPSYSTGMITGQAPSLVDVQNYFGIPSFNNGSYYLFTLNAKPVWESKFFVFKVDECCPDDLELEIDCDNGLLTIINIPSGVHTSSTSWYKGRKGQKLVLITEGEYLIPSVSIGNAGWYTLNMEFTLSNGEICTYSQTYWVPEDWQETCCEEVGPQATVGFDFLEPGIHQTLTGTHQYYEFCDNRITLDDFCEAEAHFFGLYDFDGLTGQWDPSNPINGVGPNPGLPLGNQIFSNIFPNLPNGWYVFQYGVQDPNSLNWDESEIVIHINCTVGKMAGFENEIVLSNSMKLYPNPTNGATTVDLGQLESGRVEVLTLDGKVLSTTDFNNLREVDVDITNFDSGMYWVQVTIDENTTSLKLVKE